MQLSLDGWQLILSFFNIVVVAIFSYLLWGATKHAANSNSIMSKLQQESEEMKRNNERRTLIYELVESFYTLDSYRKWLRKAQEDPEHAFSDLPQLTTPLQFPAWAPIDEKDAVYCSKVMSECLYFMLGNPYYGNFPGGRIWDDNGKKQKAKQLFEELNEVNQIFHEVFDQLMHE